MLRLFFVVLVGFTVPFETSDAAPTSCREGYFPFDGSCYKYVSQHASWTEARDYCEAAAGGHLATFHDPARGEAFRRFLASNNTCWTLSNSWIGAYENSDTDPGDVSAWIWYDNNTAVSYDMWATGYGPSQVGRNCMYMACEWGYRWMDSGIVPECRGNGYNTFICETPEEEEPPPGDRCPEDFVLLNGSFCLQYVPMNNILWNEAKQGCLDRGGQLATLETPYKATIVREYLRGLFDCEHGDCSPSCNENWQNTNVDMFPSAWIGGYLLGDEPVVDTWYWLDLFEDGIIEYFDWAPGHPIGPGDCLVMHCWEDFAWVNAESCHQQVFNFMSYLCEADLLQEEKK